MKALTLTQPWATLVAIGAKRIETRSWNTKWRGPLAIHAAKRFPIEAQELCFTEPFRSHLDNYVKLGETYLGDHAFPLGCIIATCELVNVLRITEQHRPHIEPELSFGDYSIGRYMWFLEDIKAFSEPVQAKGALGLWNWEVS